MILTMLALPSDTVRYISVVDLGLLLLCGMWLWESHRDIVPRVLAVAALLFGGVLMLFAAALVINVVSPIPPTPGAEFLAAPLSAFTAGVVGVAIWAHLHRDHRRPPA